MDAKDLRTETTLGERSSDGRNKFTQSAAAHPCISNKAYENMSNNPLGKVETPTSRPCAVIGPDRIVPPPSAEAYLKKGHYEPWPPMDNTYRQPPEYPHKMPTYISPLGNISPRQTFQENMPRIMVQPTYTSKINDDASYALDRNMSKTNKINGPSEPKYCDVPYAVNQIGSDQKNPEMCVPNVNNARNYQQMWHPAGVNMRPARPYGAPDLYQFPEYANCAGQRPVPMSRPHRTINEDPGHVYSETYYHENNIRFKPYPNIKERYPQSRYEYVSNYANPFHPPHPIPYKYDMQKPLPPHMSHPQAPIKYVDNRMSDSVMDSYQRPTHGPFNSPYRNQVIHPTYGPMMGNNVPNKIYPYPPEGSIKPISANKLPYENKLYVDYEARNKGFPGSENFYDMRPHIKNQVIVPNYPAANMQPIPHSYYRKENHAAKNLEYISHLRHLDPALNPNALNKHSSQFSPTSIAISPSDSNTSNDTVHTQGGSLEDCGYVSQSSTASMRSVDSGINRIMPNDYYRRYNYGYPPTVRTSPLSAKPDINGNNSNKNKKNIDVRQFLQMWNEGDEESGGNAKEANPQTDYNNGNKPPSQYEVAKNNEQLYVLGLMNVPSEELGKYEHIQKVSKLPENIKGYNNIELLKHFEEAIESSNLNHSTHKQHISRNYHMPSKHSLLQALPPRPLSPLDVEAKISQSVIHKEVGCNFEIKPCSPEMLNVEVATPAQNILNERTIEKVTNPLVIKQPTLSDANENERISNVMNNNDHSLILNENNKIPSCKMINTQCSNSDATNVAKPNYSLHDLESNSGVCLASLPRLDNDIELNFPEVNQQFINANKESVITTTENSRPNNNDFNMEEAGEDFETTSQVLIALESDREFSKLSKYRKIKKGDTTCKEKQFQTNSQHLRTDSVIIKNPENTKFMEYYNSENQSSDLKKDEELQDSAVGLRRNLQETEDKNLQQGSSSEIAIDFSLNKISIEAPHNVTELNDNSKDLEKSQDQKEINGEINCDYKKESGDTNLNSPVSEHTSMSNDSVIDNTTKQQVDETEEVLLYRSDSNECEITKEETSIDTLASNANDEPNHESEVNGINQNEPALEKRINRDCYNSVGTNVNKVNSSYTLQCSSHNMDNDDHGVLNTSDMCKSTETKNIPNGEGGHVLTKEVLDVPKVVDNESCCKDGALNSLEVSVDNIPIKNCTDNLTEERNHSILQTQSVKSTNIDSHDISTDSISYKNVNVLDSSIKIGCSLDTVENSSLNKTSAESNIENNKSFCGDKVHNENKEASFVITKSTLVVNEENEFTETNEFIRKSLSEDNTSLQSCPIRGEDCLSNNDSNQSIEKDFLQQNTDADYTERNHVINEIEENEQFEFHQHNKAQTVSDTNSCLSSSSLDIIVPDSKEELGLKQNSAFGDIDTNGVSKSKNDCESSLAIDSPELEIKNADISSPNLNNDFFYSDDKSQCLETETLSITEHGTEKNSDVVVSNENSSLIESDCMSVDNKCTSLDAMDVSVNATGHKNIYLNTNDAQSKDTDIVETPRLDENSHKNDLNLLVQKHIEEKSEKSSVGCSGISEPELAVPEAMDNLESDVYASSDNAYETPTCNSENLIVCSSVNGKEFRNISPKNINMRKELYSPWIQKLFFINEGKIMCNISSDLANVKNFEVINEDASFDKAFSSKHEANEQCNLSTTKEAISEMPEENYFQNSPGECEIDTTNDNIDECIEIIADVTTDVSNADDSGICGIESDISTAEASLRSERNFMLQVSCEVGCEEDSIEKSLHEIHAESVQEEVHASTAERTLSRPCLKRSLSDSALNLYTSDDVPQKSKKLKRNNKPFFNVIDIQNNRRNSISSIYNEENMSFCIVIDNNCIITEEDIEEDKKICYDISEECLRTLHTLNEDEAVETAEEIILCPQNSEEGISEYVEPLMLEISDEKSFEESWVDDVACVETVVSDDIAEDVEISAPSSPQELDESDDDDLNSFNDTNDHTEKVKYIYGNKMCIDDADLVETLYRTPQMNVNRTLASRESISSDDCDSIDKHPVEQNNKKISELCAKSEENCILEPSITDDIPESNEETNPFDFSNDETLKLSATSEENLILEPSITDEIPQSNEETNHTDFSNNEIPLFEEPIGIECQDIASTNSSHEETQDFNANLCKQSPEDVCSKHDENSSEPCVFSSPEVSSTTTEDRNSSILLKITNYKGTRTSHITDAISNKNKSNSCRFTENVNYTSYLSNSNEPRPLITKAAQKYIPPPKNDAVSDLKIKLPLPQHSLMKFKQLKISRTERQCSTAQKNITQKKPKPLFEDVLKSIDEIQFKKQKEKSKKPKKSVPKVVIKKNENGSHYASTPVRESFNPDLTGRKWQPWVFIEKNIFIDKMATSKKTKAIFSHRKNTYVFADKFKKYKSIPSAKFVISQPKLDDTSTSQFKYTIRLKHSY